MTRVRFPASPPSIKKVAPNDHKGRKNHMDKEKNSAHTEEIPLRPVTVLAPGMLVKTRNKTLYMIIVDSMGLAFMPLDGSIMSGEIIYVNTVLNLINNGIRGADFDIMEVYKIPSYVNFNLEKATNKENLIWKRKKEITLSSHEKIILQGFLYLGYTYIARDKDDHLYAFNNDIQKVNNMWVFIDSNEQNSSIIIPHDFFSFVEWEDNNPRSIALLLAM